MESIERLQNFVKMWKWLGTHPDNDQEYYFDFVMRNRPEWKNGCPLSSIAGEQCADCSSLWNRGSGTLCTDQDSPLRKWQGVDSDDPDQKMYYASQIGALGVHALNRIKSGRENRR